MMATMRAVMMAGFGGPWHFVETQHPADGVARGYAVDYTITVAPELAVWVTQTNGDVTVEGMRSSVRIDLVNGDVDLANQHALRRYRRHHRDLQVREKS